MKRYTHNLLFQAEQASRHAGVYQHPVKNNMCLLPPLRGNACMDVGGRATQEAKAEVGWGYNVKWISSLLLMVLIFSLPPATLAADDLGRLFTTPQQRNTLEKLRSQKPVEEIKIPEFTFAEPVIEEQKPVIGGITVNGLVYRKSGKSTAWINSANTYEGNFGNQYIQIDAQNIKPEDVEILIPINETKIKLKTGETYDPEADQIISPGYQDN